MNLTIEQFPAVLQPVLRYFHVDFKPRTPPRASSVALATVVAVVGSLLADWVLVKIGIAIFPGQKHYQHFQFADYSQATWLFLRMAVVVTIVLLLPDAAIWYLGQPAAGVFVLVWMHLAIAVVTYLSLIALAPVRSHRQR